LSGLAAGVLGGLLVAAAPAVSAAPEPASAAGEPADNAANAAGEASADDRRIERQGLVIDFALKPWFGGREEGADPDGATVGGATDAAAGGDDADADIMALVHGNLKFTITDAATGEPVKGLVPGAWIDLIASAGGAGGAGGKAASNASALSCQDRIGIYLGGSTGIQPMIDVNSYFIMVMNQDSTISVIDPNVLMAGTSNLLFSQIILARPGADWAQTEDQTRLFVSMPRAKGVAVIDTQVFERIDTVYTELEPMRVAIQPDGQYVWVGLNGKDSGGVAVIDAAEPKLVKEITTGRGHHEIAFTSDDRYALITNRSDGTATVIDIRTLEVVKQIEVGRAPIAAGFSPLSGDFYVADGATGTIFVIDGTGLEVTSRIDAQPGIGPMRISGDGRWLLVTNASADTVHVIDVSRNVIAHDVPIAGRPFQISVTRQFAYVRALDTERVSMINLESLDSPQSPPVVSFPLGSEPPSRAGDLPIASGIVEAGGEAAVVALDPAGNSIAYYMEGMNSPMGSFRTLGHRPRAVMVADRSLQETAPGEYTAKIKVPTPGTYEAAFVLDSPPVLHCFRFVASDNPVLKPDDSPLAVEFLLDDRKVASGAPLGLRFRLTEPATGSPRSGLDDVSVLYYRAPGYDRTTVGAREVGDGVYEAELTPAAAGAYYVSVAAPSLGAPFGSTPYLTLRAIEAKDESAGAGAGTKDPRQQSERQPARNEAAPSAH
jgi:YVTN family beta-propeller protein